MTASALHATAIHATAVVVGEQAVVIRGPSGTGKSALALALIAEAGRRGLFARLVGDDRLLVQVSGERIIVRPHPAIAGLVERRGTGLLRRPHEPAACVALVVDLCGDVPRLPTPEERDGRILDVAVPRHRPPPRAGTDERARTVLDALAEERPLHFACLFLRDAQNAPPQSRWRTVPDVALRKTGGSV